MANIKPKIRYFVYIPFSPRKYIFIYKVDYKTKMAWVWNYRNSSWVDMDIDPIMFYKFKSKSYREITKEEVFLKLL